MAYIGKVPTAVPLTGADIQDGTIQTADIADGAVTAVKTTGVGGTNTPTFRARASSNQTGLTSGGWTKVQFDTELFDVGSGYDATNDKFVVPSGEAGKYFFSTTMKVNSTVGGSTLVGHGASIYVNGSNVGQSINFYNNAVNIATHANLNLILDLSVSDYVEVYVYYQDNTTNTGSLTGNNDLNTQFFGCKLIG